MHSITMPHAGRIKSGSIVIDRTLSIYNLIAAVTIYITYTKIMVSLSGISSATGIITVEYPAVLQILTIPVIGSQYSTCIISTAHHHTRMYSIQIRNTSQITVATIGTSVAPVHQIATFGHIINRLHCFSGQSVKDGQILRACQDTSSLIPIIRIRITDHLSRSVHCSVSGLHYHFRTAVTVQIEDHKLCIMCTGAYIASHIDTPQLLPVQLITVKNHRSRITVMSVIMCIGRIPFQNNLIFTIPVYITDTGIIRSISVCLSGRSSTSLGAYQRNI